MGIFPHRQVKLQDQVTIVLLKGQESFVNYFISSRILNASLKEDFTSKFSKNSQKSSFFKITFFLLQIELSILKDGYRKPTILRRLTPISPSYDKRFPR